MRQGVSIEDVLDALQNPTRVEKYIINGDNRQRFYGKSAVTTISASDKTLIQTNPKKGS